jgi:hypothetical protein
MQFGMDQDIPSYVSRLNGTIAIAWKNYCRPLSNTCLYFPSRIFEAGVAARYVNWWNKSVLCPQGFVNNVVPQKRCASSSKCRSHAQIPPEFTLPKLVGCTVTIVESFVDGAKASKGGNIAAADVPSGSVPKLLKTVYSEKCVEDGSKTSKSGNIDDDDDVPFGSIPKFLKKIC